MQTKFMKLSIIVLLFSFTAIASEKADSLKIDRDSDKEFQQKLQKLDARYKDFFIHQAEVKRMRAERRSFAKDHKKQRQDDSAIREAHRKEFVKNRKAKVNLEVFRPEYEREKAEQKRLKRKARQRFVEKRKKLEAIEKHAKSIPQNAEVGLE